jgi:hypothetical protein
MLDDLLIATPCRADWNQMTGDDRMRTCAACSKRVFNISALTRVAAEALVASNRGTDWCGRYYQRADGTIVLADCLARGSGSGARKLALATALAAGAACAHRQPPPPKPHAWQLSDDETRSARAGSDSPQAIFSYYSIGGVIRDKR